MPDHIQVMHDKGINDVVSTKEEWKIQGIKLYQKKYYDQAMKCFVFCGEDKLA